MIWGLPMRAFVLTGYGAVSDNVQLAEIPDPVAGPGEVLGLGLTVPPTLRARADQLIE
jgi:hypothetical protein